MPLRATLVMKRSWEWHEPITSTSHLQMALSTQTSLAQCPVYILNPAPSAFPDFLSPPAPPATVGVMYHHHIIHPSTQSPLSPCFLCLQHPELQHNPTPNTCPVYWNPCTKQAKVRMKIPVPYITGKKGEINRSSLWQNSKNTHLLIWEKEYILLSI